MIKRSKRKFSAGFKANVALKAIKNMKTLAELGQQLCFRMKAFRFGEPSHCRVASGFDRRVTLIAGIESIRDLIAFFKKIPVVIS